MWLIDVKTYELKYFMAEDFWSKPLYAILSHTWGEDEVTFEDMKDLKKARQKPAFSKIAETCRLAETKKLNFAWVDTCCIDKSSSAELQEAINSMSKWYSDASVCYAYLSDVDQVEDMLHSRWFTRGWTLQELLMPEDVIFLGSKWQVLGTRISMKALISSFTGIDSEAFDNGGHIAKLKSFSVAKRMSWAANRKTTRVEDRAYSLLGIFDVSMPLLYGEGVHAFRRLQEEIFRTTADLSLFLWQFETQKLYAQLLAVGLDETQCLLAPSPDVFEEARHIRTSTTDYSHAANRNLSTVGLTAHLGTLTRRANPGAPLGADQLLLLDCYDERYPQYTMALRVFAKDNLFCSPVWSDEHRIVSARRLEKVNAVEVLEQAREQDVILLRSSEYITTTKYIQERVILHDSATGLVLLRAEPGIDFVWIRSMTASKLCQQVHQRRAWPQPAWNDETFDATKCYGNVHGSSLLYLCGALSYGVGPQDIIVAVVACVVARPSDQYWPKQHYKLVQYHLMSVESDTEEALESYCLQFIAELNGEATVDFPNLDRTAINSWHISGEQFEFAVHEQITQFGGNALAVIDIKVQ